MGEIVFGFRNVYWTLAIGMIMMLLFEKIKEKNWEKANLWFFLTIAACAILAEILHTDYGAIGIILIYILYYYKPDIPLYLYNGVLGLFFLFRGIDFTHSSI